MVNMMLETSSPRASQRQIAVKNAVVLLPKTLMSGEFDRDLTLTRMSGAARIQVL